MYKHFFIGTPFAISSWAFFFVVGLVVALAAGLVMRPKNFPLSGRGVIGCVAVIVYFSLVGGKLFAIFLQKTSLTGVAVSRHLPFTSHGHAFLGSLVFALFGFILFAKVRSKTISFLEICDFLVPGLFLVLAFVRIGCFLSGCCYGKPTDMFWGVLHPNFPGTRIHPTQIYSSIALFFIFISTRFIYARKDVSPPGITFFSTILLYGLLRFVIEYFRADSIPIGLGLTVAQLPLMGLIISGLIGVIALLLRGKHKCR